MGDLAPTPERMLFLLLPLQRTLSLCCLASPSSLAGHLFSLMVSCTSALLMFPSSVGGTTCNKVIDSRSLEGPLGTSRPHLLCLPVFLPEYLESIHFSSPPPRPSHRSLDNCRAQLASSFPLCPSSTPTRVIFLCLIILPLLRTLSWPQW